MASQTILLFAPEPKITSFNPRRDVLASQTKTVRKGLFAYLVFQSQAGCIGLSDLVRAILAHKYAPSFNPRRDVLASQTVTIGYFACIQFEFQSQAGCIGLSDSHAGG